MKISKIKEKKLNMVRNVVSRSKKITIKQIMIKNKGDGKLYSKQKEKRLS